MKHKLLSWFLLFCAVGLSITAAYYSVMGLSILFASVAIPVIVMGSFLELSKIAITTYLHDQWNNSYKLLKVYLTTALIILSFITSLGIYGLLTTGFQENISKLEIGQKQVADFALNTFILVYIMCVYQGGTGQWKVNYTCIQSFLTFSCLLAQKLLFLLKFYLLV